MRLFGVMTDGSAGMSRQAGAQEKNECLYVRSRQCCLCPNLAWLMPVSRETQPAHVPWEGYFYTEPRLLWDKAHVLPADGFW